MLRLLSLLLCTAASPVSCRGSNLKKNILLLLTDDQDVVLGGMSHMHNVQTILAQDGTTFSNAFVHTPICCPSRSTMLSGRYLHNGAARNNSISGNCDGTTWRESIEPSFTYAVEAQKAGYSTVYAGKYLNQYGILPTGRKDPNPRVPNGWTHWFGLVGNSRYYNYSVVVSDSNGTDSTLKTYGDRRDKDYLPHVLQNYTLELLPHLPEPWLMVVAWPSPHAPFTPAVWAVDHYANLTAPVTPNFNASTASMQQKHWLMRQLTPITPEEKTEHIDEVYHRRLETLLTVDDHIGKIHSLLTTQDDMWDRTVAIYTSDNGFQLGQHRLAIDKRHLYEFDIRVPLVVRGLEEYSFAKNSTIDDLVVNVDLAPTLWDIMYHYGPNATARAPLPSYMDGVSILRCHTPNQEHCRMHRRRDFLVTYNGEADPACGLADCPMPGPGEMWYMPDSFNNTYSCVRTLWVNGSRSENTIFCQFQDDERFIEFYDLKKNPHQLGNDYYDMEPFDVKRYERRLKELLSCQGVRCRMTSTPSTGDSLASAA